MKFTSANLVEDVVWQMREASRPRGEYRAEINRLANGAPPWTEDEVEKNQIKCNVNFLDMPKLLADARRSYYNAFLKPAVFFNVSLDCPHRNKSKWSGVITKEINRVMKESTQYFEIIRSQIANTATHGIGPVHWCDDRYWKPRALSLNDLLIPSNTLLSLENLTHFAIFRSYTAPELQNMISRENVDPGWNIALAKKAIEWCLNETTGTQSYHRANSAEELEEELKQNNGFYATDSAPTIDCWDFYFLSTEGDKTGWRRRIVLDTPAPDSIGGGMPDRNLIGEKHGEWLYNGNDRVYASKISEILHFQFGDLSAVAPFKYHSVRSLGWLIYAICHLQNRLRCKVTDAAFENAMQYFRIGSAEDSERLTKIDFHNHGGLPEGVEFVKQQDRWQVNQVLLQNVLDSNRSMLNEAAAQFREGRDNQSGKEKTATEIMAEVNSANALVGSMLLLAYTYQKAQYIEISRRFCMANSPDQDVRDFRLRVLKKGVPEKYVDIDYWDIEPEKVLGSGNKMLQIAIADKLMAIRGMLDPDAQRDVLRLYVAANSDDPELGTRLVPDKPILVTESMHDGQLMVGPIMQGVQMAPRAGQEPAQITTALVSSMATIMQRITMTTQVPTEQELTGLMNLGKTASNYNAVLSQDQTQAELAKQNEKALADMGKILQGWAKQVAEQKLQGEPGNGEAQMEVASEMATTKAKQASMVITAQTKAEINKANAAQKQRQRDVQFAQKLRQDEEKHTADLRKKLKETALNATVTDIQTAAELRSQAKRNAVESANTEGENNA